MKLSTIATAILAATVSMSAQAELKISGDITLGFQKDRDGDQFLSEDGSEINFDASQKKNGIKYWAHTEIDFNGQGIEDDRRDSFDGSNENPGQEAAFTEVSIGFTGDFGTISVGEIDNACDINSSRNGANIDVGGFPDIFIDGFQGSCKGRDEDNIMYAKKFGDHSFAVSHNPNEDNRHSAIGVGLKFDNIQVSLAYESIDEIVNGDTEDNIMFGLRAKFGPMYIRSRVNDYSLDEDVDFGVTLGYKSGANEVYGSYGEEGEREGYALGYRRKLGGKTSFIIEGEEDTESDETRYGIGLRHDF